MHAAPLKGRPTISAHGRPTISVVLPVHNQAAHIAAIVGGYRDALGEIGRPYEIVLVLNGCRDESFAVCTTLAQTFPDITVIDDPRAGWGLAVKAGLRAARGDLLCYTNCARTSAADLEQLIGRGLEQPHTVFKAIRRVRDNWKRRLGSFLYNAECRLLFGLPTRDVNATPKVFSRSHDALLTLTSDDDMLDAEFMSTCVREGIPVVEVPIFSNRRQGGSSTTNYTSAVRMYVGAWRLWLGAR
ncbi:MAG TPA: glycosyltransferase family 2 protein [Vicinamibacterales bacterium]|nr:glycosyltransferase family 2 protein [Vicinamibacterales bacterium]